MSPKPKNKMLAMIASKRQAERWWLAHPKPENETAVGKP